MIPDKIYIQSRAIDYWLPRQNIVYTKRLSDTSIEYLRKDALLEWLQKEYETISWYHEKMKHVTGCIGDTDSSGKAEAYKKVIDKLISL